MTQNPYEVCIECQKPFLTGQFFVNRQGLPGVHLFCALKELGIDSPALHPSFFNAKANSPAREAPLTFERFRAQNVRRCNRAFFPVSSWSPQNWAENMLGTSEDILNLVSSDPNLFTKELVSKLSDLLGSLVTYADLFASRLDIDLSHAVTEKFNNVSLDVGSGIKI